MARAGVAWGQTPAAAEAAVATDGSPRGEYDGAMARRFLLAAVVLAVVATPLGHTATPETSLAAKPASRAKLKRQLNRIVASGVPGALAYVRDSRGTWRGASGYANLDPKNRMQSTYAFRIGSVTKTFVATVILQLASEEKLSLGDTVERWLPGAVPNGDHITIRQLLNHTSGLFDYMEDTSLFAPYVTDRAHVIPPRDLLAAAVGHPPLFPPGARWSYSNTNYIVLGLIAEAVTGLPLEVQLRDRLFRPLGLAHTSFPTTPALPNPHAHSYLTAAEAASIGFPRRRLDVTDVSPSFAWASAAVVSTAEDVARFYRRLLSGQVLAADQLRAMRTTLPAGGFGEYGLGLTAIRLRPCGRFWGHAGSMLGFQTFAWSSPNGSRQVVLMVNISLSGIQGTRVDAFLYTALCS
jgi:D-alanyl-D-alanine carboxypeptidase